MSDYISREAAIGIFTQLWDCIGTIMDRDEWEDACRTTANELPSADVRENIRGEWEQVVSGCAILMRCNQCKNAISENDFFEICRKVNHGSKLLDFCPNCGADMRGGQDG